MTDEAVIACPVGEIIGNPSAHGRAVAVGARHSDMTGLLIIDVSARRSEIQTVAFARVDLGSLFVESESLHPAWILIHPRILHTVGLDPSVRAPRVEHECPVLSREGCDGMRTNRPGRQFGAYTDRVEAW